MDHIPEFEITTYRFDDKQYREWTFPYDYHYLYILENGKDAYVGETNDIIKRSKAHHGKTDPCYPFRFRRIHVITGRDITATPAKHYENLLIKLMRIDRRFHIRNTDPGVRTFYAAKNEFELGFDLLWVKLAERGLVRRTKFSAILNSSEYKYSPLHPSDRTAAADAAERPKCPSDQRYPEAAQFEADQTHFDRRGCRERKDRDCRHPVPSFKARSPVCRQENRPGLCQPGNPKGAAVRIPLRSREGSKGDPLPRGGDQRTL